MKRKWVIDFDRVAFNTERLYAELEGMEKPEPGTEVSLHYLEMQLEGGLQSLLYPGFLEFAKSRQAAGEEIILLSSAKGLSGQWDAEYQAQKIAMSGIKKYITNHKLVEAGKKAGLEELCDDETEVIYIEDSVEHLQSGRELQREGLSLKLVHMMREDHPKLTEFEKLAFEGGGILRVKNFAELIERLDEITEL